MILKRVLCISIFITASAFPTNIDPHPKFEVKVPPQTRPAIITRYCDGVRDFDNFCAQEQIASSDLEVERFPVQTGESVILYHHQRNLKIIVRRWYDY